MFLIARKAIDLFLSTSFGSLVSSHILTLHRLGTLVSAYLHYAETHLYSLIPDLTVLIPKFLIQIEEDYKSDPSVCTRNLLSLKEWFITYLSTGLLGQGSLPEALWDKVLDLPKLIGPIVAFIHKMSNLEHRSLVSAWVINVLSLSSLSIDIITAQAISDLENKSTTTDFNATSIFTLGMSALGLIPIKLFQQLLEYASDLSGYLIRGFGPNGILGWTAVNDARSLLSSAVFACFGQLAEIIGANKLVPRAKYASRLPLISNFTQVPNLFGLILTHTMDSGVKAIVTVNYWLLVLIRPFFLVMETSFGLMKEYVCGSAAEILDTIRASTKPGNKGGVAFNVFEGSAIPLKHVSLFLDTLFGQKIGELFLHVFSPASIGNPLNETEILTPNLLIRNVVAIRYIVIMMFVVIINSLISSLGLTNSNLFYFNNNGDFVIMDHKLAHELTTLLTKMGIAVTFSKTNSFEDAPSFTSFHGQSFWSGFNVSGISIFCLNAVIVMNSLAWRLQVSGQASGSFFSSEAFWNFIAPFLNAVDLKHLTLLNTLPSIISGIVNPFVHASFSSVAGGAWYTACGVTTNDVIQLYLYVLVVDCLTRLDSALRVSANYLQFSTMVSARDNIDRFIDGDGKVHPLQALKSLLIDTAIHPFLWAFQSVVAVAISNLFTLLNASATLLSFTVFAVYEVIILLSSFTNSAVDYSWYMIHKNHIAKMIKLMQKANDAGLLPAFTHTTKLPGYGHPFVVSFKPGCRTTIGTISGPINMPVFDASATSLSRLASYNPYAS